MIDQGDKESNFLAEPLLRKNTRVDHDYDYDEEEQEQEQRHTNSSSKRLDNFSACCLLLFANLFTFKDTFYHLNTFKEEIYWWEGYAQTFYSKQVVKPAIFIVIGTVYLVRPFLCINMYKRLKSDSPLAIIMISSALIGDILWLIATTRGARSIGTWDIFARFWLSAGLLTLLFVAFDLVMNLIISSKAIGKTFALALTFIASILMTAGGIMEASVESRVLSNSANASMHEESLLFLCGSILYLVYALLNFVLIFITK